MQYKPGYLELPVDAATEFSGCRAERCVECGKSPVKRWWLGKVDLGSKETYVVASDCGECTSAVKTVFLEGHKRAQVVRELSWEEIEVMRIMIS